jgi:two-component system phosphate regulon response regulator PhoB
VKRDTVLIVEDDVAVRRMYRTALGFAGFDVIEVHDGTAALHVLEQRTTDVVILDLMLPTLSGLAVQQEIASNARTRDIPIIIVTGSDMRLDGVKVTCILRKPISPELLVTTVRTCVRSVPDVKEVTKATKKIHNGATK